MRGFGYRPALDGVRGVAIVLVLLRHLGTPGISQAGATGVAMFFTLSGFLITWLLVAELHQRDRISLGLFYARRGLRLLPVLFVLVVLVVFYKLTIDHAASSWTELGASLFYAENWLRVGGLSGTGLVRHTWSLSVEEQFYLAWPLLLILIRPTTVRRWQILFGVTIVGILAGMIDRAYASPARLEYGTDTHVVALLLGCALALWLSSGRRLHLDWRLAAAGLALVALQVRSGSVTATALGTALLIGALMTSGAGTRVFGSWPLRSTGRISYGLYLWHYPLIVILAPHLAALPPLARGVVLVAISYSVAITSYRYVELPFLRRKSQFSPSARATRNEPTGDESTSPAQPLARAALSTAPGG